MKKNELIKRLFTTTELDILQTALTSRILDIKERINNEKNISEELHILSLERILNQNTELLHLLF